MTRQGLIINRQDADRLQRMIDTQQYDDELSNRLESRLIQAEIVTPDDFPEDRVSMRSRLRLKGSRSGDSELTLHYPTPDDGECMSLRSHLPQSEAQESSLALCIMSPLGIALLGMAVGEQITVPREDGQSDVIRLEAILHQSEACSQFHL